MHPCHGKAPWLMLIKLWMPINIVVPPSLSLSLCSLISFLRFFFSICCCYLACFYFCVCVSNFPSGYCIHTHSPALQGYSFILFLFDNNKSRSCWQKCVWELVLFMPMCFDVGFCSCCFCCAAFIMWYTVKPWDKPFGCFAFC